LLSVIFVRKGIAEVDQKTVAQELRDAACMTLYNFGAN